jgi:SAM-dependent methyltransferase
MTPSAEAIAAGHAVYTDRTLKIYDALVLGLSNFAIWKCPTTRLLALYDAHVSANHLDVGVGTGFFLDRCAFPTPAPRVALMDLNETALAYAARRIARLSPEIYARNALEPIPFDAPKFDSVAINYLLHCLPGAMTDKAVLFDHVAALMNPGATLFGATLLPGAPAEGWAARRLMDFYNRKGIFCNRRDDAPALEQALKSSFRAVTVDYVGCAALFSASL